MSVEAGQFVDTNVLVYAYDSAAGAKHIQAKTLMGALWDSKAGCLSVQVLQEFYVNVTQKIVHPLDVALAIQIIDDLASWKVYVPTARDVVGAIGIQQQYQLLFWDAMIVWGASRLGCEVLWSEDLNPGQIYEGVLLKNPFLHAPI